MILMYPFMIFFVRCDTKGVVCHTEIEDGNTTVSKSKHVVFLTEMSRTGHIKIEDKLLDGNAKRLRKVSCFFLVDNN